MIKINLLEETRQQVKAKASSGPKLQVAGNVGVVVLLGGIIAAGAAAALYYVYVAQTLRQLEADIQRAEAEKARLEYVIKRNDELQKKKEDLNRKIGIIADLKRRQDLPVRLMDLISRNLADFVWLEDVTYTGELVTVKGKAQTPIALANFLRSLEDSPFFEDVALGRQDNNPTTGLTNFDLTMTFKPAGKAAKASGPSGASAPPPA